MNREITIFFDYNCPFCYIEFLRLHSLTDQELSITWRSYNKPENASPAAKPADYGRQVQEHLQKMRDKGLHIQSPKIKGSTFLAHTGGKYAIEKGYFDIYQQRIFEAIWKEDRTVDSPETLAALAEEIGMDRIDFRQALDSDKYQKSVEMDFAEVEKQKIWTIPYYIGEQGRIEINHFNEMPSVERLLNISDPLIK